MRAVITVVGKDTVGILSKVSTACAQAQANIIEVSQSTMQDMFCMIMLTELSDTKESFSRLSADLEKTAHEQCLDIHVMHEDIFNSMHRI